MSQLKADKTQKFDWTGNNSVALTKCRTCPVYVRVVNDLDLADQDGGGTATTAIHAYIKTEVDSAGIPFRTLFLLP